MLDAEVIDDPDDLEPLYEAWDHLVTDHGSPFSAPAWIIAWLRNPPLSGSHPRVIVVRDGNNLLGILPFCWQRSSRGIGSYALAGPPTSVGSSVVVTRGKEAAVYRAAGRILAHRRWEMDMIRMEGVPASTPISVGLRESYHGSRLSIERLARIRVPVIDMRASTYSSWLERRRTSIRRELMRKRRRCLEDGYTLATLTAARDVDVRIEPFLELHSRRWDDRGGSGAIHPRLADMLREVSRRLDGSRRLRLSVLELDGQLVSADMTLSTGKVSSGWLGGFEASAARYQPGMQTMLASVEYAWAAGDTVFDLGPGSQPHKRSLATDESFIESWILARRGAPYTSVIQLLPWQVVRRTSPTMRALRAGGTESNVASVV